MAFVWKDRKDIWKGEGIYFFTFVVRNRARLLGKLRRLDAPDSDGHIAVVDATALGNAVYQEFNALQARHEGFHVVAKQVMPDHFHAVAWCKGEFGDASVKMVMRGFSQACSKVARRLAETSPRCDRDNTNGTSPETSQGTMSRCVPSLQPQDAHMPQGAHISQGAHMPFLQSQSHCDPPLQSQSHCDPSLDCGNGATTLFEPPFIRTLTHAGQLRHMIDYTHANPDNAQRVVDNPGMYVIRRNKQYAGLAFDTMGKERLLEYPDRQVVALSRSLTQEQIADEVRRALARAQRGVVTYTAAINDGEKAVAKAVREAGYPLVVMMLEGFPKEGTEAARYFHPGRVYHVACGEGRLYLMAPLEGNYDNSRLIEQTEAELTRKASEKGQRYTGIPRTSLRWRMIAGNMMLRMIAMRN